MLGMQLEEAAPGTGPGSWVSPPDTSRHGCVALGAGGLVAASLRGFEEPGRSRARLRPEHHLRHPGMGEFSDKKAAIVEKTEWNNKKDSLLSTETLY